MTKWAGSLEIGVTTHNPETLKFPSTMTNIEQPGTWMLSGGSIVCNGVTVIEEYGPTLDEIKVCYHILSVSSRYFKSLCVCIKLCIGKKVIIIR